MKKSSCLLILLLSLPMISIAQQPMKDIVVSAGNMNILYLGIHNPVEIAVPGIKADRVTATITKGTIAKSAEGWEAVPLEMGESIISVLVDNKKVAEKKFRIEPVAIFAGKYSGTLLKDDALKIDLLEIKLPDLMTDIKIEIESFSMVTSREMESISAKGNKLTEEMKSRITRLSGGNTIIFENIKAISPDGKIMTLSPIVLKVK
ncbi:MAG: GldM family protein [Bacteroidia bacterium]|nr:GldM family protein [Bacteroidia bacterium]